MQFTINLNRDENFNIIDFILSSIILLQARCGQGQRTVIAVDIYRVENGKLKEYLDVLQEEVQANESESGRPMLTGN